MKSMLKSSYFKTKLFTENYSQRLVQKKTFSRSKLRFFKGWDGGMQHQCNFHQAQKDTAGKSLKSIIQLPF